MQLNDFYARHELYSRLTSNGWKRSSFGKDEYSTYTMTIVVEYNITCTVNIAETSEQLHLGGQYGVAWIDVDTENSAPYQKEDLLEMLEGISRAEDNLLLIGIPFRDGYEFSGRNAGNKARRNAKIRRDLGLDELERKEGFRNE
jgi:hypothetical protein